MRIFIVLFLLGLSGCATTVKPVDTSRIEELNRAFQAGEITMETEARGLFHEAEIMFPNDPHARALALYRIQIAKQYDKQEIDYDGFLSRWAVAVADYQDKLDMRLANRQAQKPQGPGFLQSLLLLQLINRPFNQYRGYGY